MKPPRSPESHRVEHSLENYFNSFRENIIGNRQSFNSAFGTQQIVYADWTASGRAYRPIEEQVQKEILPFIANTHTGSTFTGTKMTAAYNESKRIIKEHVNAGDDDIILFCGSGMTAAVNKLQRILGLRVPEQFTYYMKKGSRAWPALDEQLKPVVFISHMEHHSNQITWLETIADVEIIRAAEDGNVDLEHFCSLLEKYRYRKNKIAAVSACSNVTGIQTPYHDIARLIHLHEGLCFVDFATSAPYVAIDMHPADIAESLDAIYFSSHKFLGGPGTPGILLFNKKLYKNIIPDHPGGGTVIYSNPWKQHEYISDIEEKEDGGTPPLTGAIKAAYCIKLKEQMGIENILNREAEICRTVFSRFSTIPRVEVLEKESRERLAIFSFATSEVHYNLFVRLLNDRFGIQARGGCSCAGTYGHYLLQVDRKKSENILAAIRSGNRLVKPGWVRVSFHPCMSDGEIDFIMDAIELTVSNSRLWKKDYCYDNQAGDFRFKALRL